ncbi:unnamed protein product, partial [Prunus brigantina]
MPDFPATHNLLPPKPSSLKPRLPSPSKTQIFRGCADYPAPSPTFLPPKPSPSEPRLPSPSKTQIFWQRTDF